jgi:hypothetical protein
MSAAVACQPHERERLERLCRYIMRPAICLDRLCTNSAGQVVYRLKQPFRDATTHVLFSPEDFIAPLAALVPRPGCNLTRYHGVFAPCSPFRRHVVPDSGKQRRRKGKASSCSDDGQPPTTSDRVDHSDPPVAPLTWAQRQVGLRARHHPLPVLWWAAARHCRRHRSRRHWQDPRSSPPARPAGKLPGGTGSAVLDLTPCGSPTPATVAPCPVGTHLPNCPERG